MELLNIGFVILLVKIAICVLPGVFGVFLLSISEEKKRELRNSFCNYLFGVSNAIPYPNFDRALLIVGILSLLLSALASWFLLIAGMLEDSSSLGVLSSVPYLVHLIERPA